MKFILSFPEICAKIVCPFPMSTWNVVLGIASTTTPSTSIMSDFAKCYPSWSGFSLPLYAAMALRSSLFVIFSLLLIFSATGPQLSAMKRTCFCFSASALRPYDSCRRPAAGTPRLFPARKSICPVLCRRLPEQDSQCPWRFSLKVREPSEFPAHRR